MILVSEFLVNFRPKILNDTSMEFMEWLNENAVKEKERKDTIHWGKAILITTGSNLLDTKYEFYGFNNDLRDTIN